MKAAVTILDIAAKAGFHYSTVSLALRGDPRIRDRTRELIERVAEEMGYQPDPMLKALSVYRQSVRPASYQSTVAWLSAGPVLQTHRPDYLFRDYFNGATSRGAELGYRIEEFALGDTGMNARRLEKVLRARGISGVLIAPLPGPRASGRINLDWSRFHAVTFGYSLVWPSLHRVTAHHSGAAKTAVRKLYSLGHRRIGICVDETANRRVDGNWLGGYMAETFSRKMKPLVFLRHSRSYRTLLTETEAPKLRRWILSNRIEALIFDYSAPFVSWIREVCRLRVPGEISVVSLNVREDDTTHSGIDQRDGEIGRSALDTLASLVHTHERGIPDVPRKLLIEGGWRSGTTVARSG